MNLRFWQPKERAAASQISFDDWLALSEYGGLYGLLNQTLVGDAITVAPGMTGIIRGAYKANPIVFAAIDNRQALFSQARFAYRRLRNGRPGDIIGNQAAIFDANGNPARTINLGLLERPWPGGSTSDLLSLAEVWASCAGVFYATRRQDRVVPLRPDWMGVILGRIGSADPLGTETDDPLSSLDLEIAGYAYLPGGPGSGKDPIPLDVDEVACYMPRPDPEAPWRGMSWISPVIEDVLADRQMTDHKRKYLEAGGTPNHAVMLPVETIEAFEKWTAKIREEREGARGNPYKALYLAKGADAKALGANLDQLRFDEVQKAGEVRIAVAAGVPPAVLSISAGLDGSALNAGNFQAAWQQFANQTIRPNWGTFARSIAKLVEEPQDGELWYDDRDIPALAEDIQKRATVQQAQAATINTLITAGFDPDSVVQAVLSDDLTLLTHTGLTSVQLLPPGSNQNGSAHHVSFHDLAALTAAANEKR